MDCCTPASPLLSFEQALEKILTAARPLTATEQIPLTEAAGRITAQAVISPRNVPPFDNSAMDGYAVRLTDLAACDTLPVAGKAFAGAPFAGEWPLGSCLRIMTGAPTPQGTDAVIMQEQTETTSQGIRFLAPPKKGQNIRRIGDDIHQGDAVLPAGTKLGGSELPLLASLGIETLTVYRRLKVALLSTGDELQSVGEPLSEGQIYDTNRFVLRIMLQKLGCDILDLGIVRDDPHALRQAFHTADNSADLVISSGGVSVGEADYTKQILDELGEINFWKLAMKPGKPFAFGKLRQAWFCGLPGNPVSATVTFYQLVQPLLARLSGHSQWQAPRRFQVRSADTLKKAPGRLDFQRGVLRQTEQGEWVVHSTGHQGSHVFSSITEGNCFILLARDQGTVQAGEWVTVEPFNSLLRSE